MPSRSPGSARVNRHHAPRRHGRRFHSGDNVKAKIQDEEGIFVGPATSEFRQASNSRVTGPCRNYDVHSAARAR